MGERKKFPAYAMTDPSPLPSSAATLGWIWKHSSRTSKSLPKSSMTKTLLFAFHVQRRRHALSVDRTPWRNGINELRSGALAIAGLGFTVLQE
jgi:hypothetical protein